MTNRSPSYDDAYQSRMTDPWDTPEHAPTPGYFGRTPATLLSPSPAPEPGLQPDQLGFLPLSQWEESIDYDEQPPKYICYTIAWKLVLNRKTVGKVTEEDLVVAPSEYWEESLKADVDDMLRTKKKRHKRVRSEGTAITVSVDDRSQRDLEKFYNSDINWTLVEKQLRKWSNLLRIGKKITVIIALNYRYDDVDDAPITSASRRVEKRGRGSRTTRMLAEREECINAEEENTGQPSTWSLVYERMRCHVRSCPLRSDWCWEDPRDKKHYKLRAPHLERLIDHVDGGGSLESHEDVPDDIRRDVVLESQIGRKSRKMDSLPTAGVPYPPININLMSAETARASTITPSPPRFPPDGCLHIPGPREEAVRDYCKWLESQVTEEAYKADFRRICRVILENHLDLELIFEDPDSGFFIQQGIKLGTARRFLRDIHQWAGSAEPHQGSVEEQ
ncbi:uncharacterized protein LDX57_007852 [Aspergillus melleus]|uniref:uncharacterized protein n=1 Tax=Aspergillus melleus TaxID=138277 RepID=UPI001E8D4CC8|nr:uncharacterized protein LDX57_007852 [Aspergillus melleus]KAH8430182.1 hypothetical protein LDX57_007852 [Aspergillus melleus]